MPVRSCVACGREGEKNTFLRVVRTPDGSFLTDESGKAQGRGAYICKSADCAAIAFKKSAFNRSFRERVPREIYDGLRERFEGR